MVSAKVGSHKAPIKNIMLNNKKLLDKTLSNKRRDCSGEHLLHEEAFLNGIEQAEESANKTAKLEKG